MLRWSLGLWCLAAALLLGFMPPPPPLPVTSTEDEAIFQRRVDQTVEKTRRWQQERGDETIAWGQARGRLAVVVDDVGRELQLFEQLHALRFPLTFSVLPDAPYAPGVQLRLRADRRRPRDILLQFFRTPEEPATRAEGAEPDEQFLGASDRAVQLHDALTAALQRVPAAVGVNDHRGSLGMNSRAMQDALMPVLQARGLYFLGSQTTLTPAPGHDLVLATDPSPSAVLAQLELAAGRAELRPQVVITHPSPAVVEALREGLPRLRARGIGVYPLSELLAHERD